MKDFLRTRKQEWFWTTFVISAVIGTALSIVNLWAFSHAPPNYKGAFPLLACWGCEEPPGCTPDRLPECES